MSSNPNFWKLIWIFTAILLPVIPSILLFKLLPKSRAAVKGPFKGLQINLGGAVGAYFLLVLVISFGPSPTPPTPAEIWTIKGIVQDESGQILGADKVNMNVQPKTVEYHSDGSFQMKVLVKKEMGKVEMPEALNVAWQPVQPFGNATVHFDPRDQIYGEKYTLKTDGDVIRIVEPIKLKNKVTTAPETPYDPPAATPRPTAVPAPSPTPTSTPTP